MTRRDDAIWLLGAPALGGYGFFALMAPHRSWINVMAAALAIAAGCLLPAVSLYLRSRQLEASIKREEQYDALLKMLEGKLEPKVMRLSKRFGVNESTDKRPGGCA